MGKQCNGNLRTQIRTGLSADSGYVLSTPRCQRHPAHSGDCEWKSSERVGEHGAIVVRSISVTWPKNGTN